MEASVLEPIDEYITRGKNNISQYIATWKIYNILMETEMIIGPTAPLQCWYEEEIDLAESQAAAEARVLEEEGGEVEYDMTG